MSMAMLAVNCSLCIVYNLEYGQGSMNKQESENLDNLQETTRNRCNDHFATSGQGKGLTINLTYVRAKNVKVHNKKHKESNENRPFSYSTKEPGSSVIFIHFYTRRSIEWR